jgi:hypothetical protein
MDNRAERIKEIAYRLWEQEGRPDGHSDRLWLAAEAQYEADIAKERYAAEIAKNGGEPAAGEKRARSAKSKSEEPAGPPPAPDKEPRSAKASVFEMPPAKKAPAAKAAPSAERPAGSGKRKPPAT